MKVSIVGVTGYSGLELLRILKNHPHVDVVSVHASKEVGQRISYIYPHVTDVFDHLIEEFNAERIMEIADLVFFATPSGISKDLATVFVQNQFPVIDLSGDHRLPAKTYKQWYGKEPASEDVIAQFSYGLTEFSNLT